MKLTTFIMITVILHVSAASVAQKITLKEKNAPLITIFDQISAQTGYDFAFTTDALKDAKPVTINVTNEELSTVLTQIFQGQNLDFSLDNKTVTIKPKETSLLDKLKAAIAAIDVTGRVVGEDGQPLPGATVIVKGGSNSTTTDANGYFTLKNVDPNAILQITFIGYQKLGMKASANLGTIKMTVTESKLDEVKVIAYGETTERLSIGNIATVSSKDIAKQPVGNPLLALEGRVPGLFITQQNGMPGAAVNVRIQGQNSIQYGNDPFYVIDGVPYSSQSMQSLTTSPGGGSSLNFINPSDIESISILKDADATAIYGSRAANGAIIITTKKGKAGDTRVDFNLREGLGKVTRTLPVLNTTQYLQMRREAIRNDGLTVQPTDYDINGTWDTTRNINWQKELIGGTAHYTNLDGSVSGGTINSQYLIGTTYYKETGVFPGNASDQKASVHFNITTRSANGKFRIQLTGSDLVDENILPGGDLTTPAFLLAPDAPPLYNKDGSINWALDQNGNSTWIAPGVGNNYNPVASDLQKYTGKSNNLNSNAVLSYLVLPGLELKSSFGYSNQQVNETRTIPLTAIAPQDRSFTNRTASYSRNGSSSWIIEPQINYKKVWRKANFEALIGSTIQQNNTNMLSLNGTSYSSDLVLDDPASAGTVTTATSQSVYKYNAVFGRVNFNWDEKYLINVTARRDGSSRFGSANEFHNFASIGGGWLFSNEPFIKDNIPFISFGKLKGSYGTTGNDQIGNYAFLSLYGPNENLPYQGVNAIVPQGLTNPYLQWEETKKIEFGSDLGFLHDRILVNATYYWNRSSNQLLQYRLPIITGFSFINKNFPATVQNTGWEFTVNSVNVKSRQFTWTTAFNLTLQRNKLVAFPGLESSSYASSYEIGKPIIGTGKYFHFLGVNPTTGVYQFADSKGNPTSNPVRGTDNTVFISQSPKYYGGFGNNFTYKGFELELFFQFVKQTGTTYPFGNSYPGYSFAGNQPVWILNRWQKPGDNASVQRLSTNFSYRDQFGDANLSDGAITDASYIRLKNLSFSWKLPSAWIAKAHFQTCKIYMQAQNLLTITKYKGLDPEMSGTFVGLPPLRLTTFGLQVGL